MTYPRYVTVSATVSFCCGVLHVAKSLPLCIIGACVLVQNTEEKLLVQCLRIDLLGRLEMLGFGVSSTKERQGIVQTDQLEVSANWQEMSGTISCQ